MKLSEHEQHLEKITRASRISFVPGSTMRNADNRLLAGLAFKYMGLSEPATIEKLGSVTDDKDEMQALIFGIGNEIRHIVNARDENAPHALWSRYETAIDTQLLKTIADRQQLLTESPAGHMPVKNPGQRP